MLYEALSRNILQNVNPAKAEMEQENVIIQKWTNINYKQKLINI